MALVSVPSLMQDLTAGQGQIDIEGETIREIILNFEKAFPGVKDRLCDGDRIKPFIAVYVGSELSQAGMREPVNPDSEIHFVPAISGG